MTTRGRSLYAEKAVRFFVFKNKILSLYPLCRG